MNRFQQRRENRLRGKKNPSLLTQGLASIEQTGITLPDEDEVKVVKEVPAGFDHPETGEKVIVGVALIHNDGQVTIRFDEDAPQWAMDHLKVEAQSVGYSFETLTRPPLATPKESDGSP